MEMKNNYYRPKKYSEDNRIVYHTQNDFKRDMLFLAVIILIGVVTAVTGLIAILIQVKPNL
jgi:hypothetical protein